MPSPMKNPTQASASHSPSSIQKPSSPATSCSTVCNPQHLCCMLLRPLPLTPPQHKKHVNNLILRATSALESSPSSSTSLHASLRILDTAVTYANTHGLYSHEAQAQLWRGHVLLKLGYLAEASWCATRAFGWVEKGTGVEGKGQRWAASLKIEAERARGQLEKGDPRKVIGVGFMTVPGRESGVVARKRARKAEVRSVRTRRASNAVAIEENEKVLPQPPSHFSWSSVRHESPLSFRHRMSMMMHKEQVLTPPKSHFSESSGGHPSPASIPHIGPKRVAIVHEAGGELWKRAAPRSSLVLGNKDLRRTLHVVNRPDSDPRSRWSIRRENMEDGTEQHAP